MAHLDHTPDVPETTDEWHMHSVAEGVPQEEHGSTVNAVLLFFAFIGTVLSIVLVVVLTYVYFSTYMNQLRRTQIETTVLANEYLEYRDRARESLVDYEWVSIEGEGVVSLPLDVAMERVLERYSGAAGGGEQQGGSGR